MHTKLLAIFVALTVLLAINAYVMMRGWQVIPSTSAIRPTYIVSMILLFLFLVAGLIFGRNMEPAIAKLVTFIGFSYLLVFVYLFISFHIVDLIRLANYFFHFLSPGTMFVFRQWAFVGSLALIFIVMIIGNYKFNHPEIVNLDIDSSKPIQNKSVRIVAVSDVHLGVSINKKNLKQYVELINSQKPDIVLMVGDISDNFVSPIIEQKMAEEIRTIQAPLGVYAINGNHEFYGEKPTAMQEYLASAGVKVLTDSSALINNEFYIVGRKDRSDVSRKSLKELVAGLNPTIPSILLDHQPYNLEQAKQNNIDLQLSGHTHNGQFFPGNLVVKMIYELGHGYMKKGNTHYYVSSGLGIWGPQYRIGTQSEIVVVNFSY